MKINGRTGILGDTSILGAAEKALGPFVLSTASSLYFDVLKKLSL